MGLTSGTASSLSGRVVGPADGRPASHAAHRAHPPTSAPEDCARWGVRRTIDRGMDSSALAPLAALLEREHEVERIRAALRAVGQRSGGALVIEGPAGMGKSRLLEV